jgi:phosphoribosylglycinamide formyltransferase-1
VSGRRITVLISGNGSNLQALIDARDSGRLKVEISHVISNRADAFGLERARKAGIPTSILPPDEFPLRLDYDRALAELIAVASPELVVLAGFMRIVGPLVLQRCAGQLINLHPSLLPLYRGTNTYHRAIACGDTEHGASVHFVTAELDAGPVIAQVRIPIEARDEPATLAARLSPREHQLLVATVELFNRCSVQCTHGAITVNGEILTQPFVLRPDGTF